MATENAAPDKMKLDRTNGTSTIDLYRAALGPVRSDYYLKAFTRFDAAGKAGPSWNVVAALLTLNWMAFRKLWGAALAYVGAITFATLLLFGIGRLVLQWTDEVQWSLLGLEVLLAVVVPGLLGNGWLYAACTKRVEAALTATATIEEACALLAKQAAGHRRTGAIAAVNVALIAAAAGMVTSWPHGNAVPPLASRTDGTHAVVSGPVQIGHIAPAPAVAASTPAPAASATVSAPAMAASLPALTASAPQATASTPKAVASAPAAVASVPVAMASAPEAPAKQEAPTEKPHKPSKAEKRLAAKADAAAKAKAKAKTTATATVKETAKETAKVPAKAAAKATAKPETTTQGQDQYLINVGLFADENNALNAYTKLKDAGLPAISQPVKSSKGPRTRVRVGPFETEAEADRAADSIRAMQLEAQVFKP